MNSKGSFNAAGCVNLILCFLKIPSITSGESDTYLNRFPNSFNSLGVFIAKMLNYCVNIAFCFSHDTENLQRLRLYNSMKDKTISCEILIH